MRRRKITRHGYHRRGYYRKPYTRRDGAHVRGSYVKPTYVGPAKIEDVGAVGKGKKIITIKESGELTKHGYATSKSAKARREALRKAVKEDGALTVWRRLHAQVNLRKGARGKRAENRRVFKRDRDWVRDKYHPDVAVAARKKWMSMSKRERAAAMPGG